MEEEEGGGEKGKRHGDGANSGLKWGYDCGSWIGESSRTFLSFRVCCSLGSEGWVFKQHVAPANPLKVRERDYLIA